MTASRVSAPTVAWSVPPTRLREMNAAPVRPERELVLYWMTATRRARHNFALQHAVELSNALGKPLLVLEPLRVDYPWASERLHRFAIGGMADNAAALSTSSARYHPYVERTPGEGRGLVEALSLHACAVVTDTYPSFVQRLLPEKLGPRLDVKLEAVDSCGLLPLSASDRAFPTAHSFRRFVQRTLTDHLDAMPLADPLAGLAPRRLRTLPRVLRERWPALRGPSLRSPQGLLDGLPIDHRVAGAAERGGSEAAASRLKSFVAVDLARYGEGRNHPDDEGSSGLSPWLHFGHIASAEIFLELAAWEGWTPDRLRGDTRGSRSGWWGMSEPAEAFVDQLLTWRELGLHQCHHREDYDRYESLPGWAQKTLGEHARDPRPHRYDRSSLQAAETHDAIWNAAQRQLLSEGRMHNYLRMLWGKKILEWSKSPQEALDHMIELNNRYALDGRDPNSTSGIFWVLGRYDRPWGPERPIFGKVRYMSSENTRRKLRLKRYLERFGPVTRDHGGSAA